MNLDQIIVTPLKKIHLNDGDVFHGMKNTDIGFVKFAEVYFSQIHNNSIKAWKKHLRMTLNLVVPLGNVKFVFINDDGEAREEIIGVERYSRLTVPPNIWFGFQGLSSPYSLLMNVADIIHDPNEVERKKIDEIIYDWK